MLDGLRVVELGVWAAGPGAGAVLAEWGADVIKVEGPDGDPARRMLAVTGGGRDDLPSPTFDLDNRGKRSVVLDLADPDGSGRVAMTNLLATADVFLTNLRPDAVDRLGLGVEALLSAHPRLVYASVTGYGRSGPDAHRAGYDFGGFWAWSGVASLAVAEGDPQTHFPAAMGDHVTAMNAVAGILAALLERTTTGRGRLVETSLLRSGMWTIGWPLNLRLRFGNLTGLPRRDEAPNPMINPYRAADDRWFWLLGTEAQRMWVKVLPAIGRDDLADDDRFRTPRDRRRHAAGADRTARRGLRRAHARGVDPDLRRARRVVGARQHGSRRPRGPTGPRDRRARRCARRSWCAAAPCRRHAGLLPHSRGGDAAHPRRPVPALGEHTTEILTELGL